MVELFEANWPILLIALLIGLAIAWYIFHARRTTRVAADRRDVLDEGADRAQRNQALLDAPARPAADAVNRSAGPDDSVPSPRPQPPGTASFPLPGAIAGVETVVNAVAGTPEAVTLTEEEETRSAPQSLADAGNDPWRVVPTDNPAPHMDVADPASPDGSGSDLTRLKGVGPKLALRLNELSVTRIEQVAAWGDADIDRIDRELGRFQGRIRRDDWVGQARLLAAGDRAGFEEKFGRL